MKKTVSDKLCERMAVGDVELVSRLARAFRVRRAEIEDAVYDLEGFDLVVGFRTGGGHGYLNKSQWSVERYE